MRAPRFKPKDLTEAQRAELKAKGVNVAGNTMFRAGWDEVGGQRCYFRSGWEWRYAKHLEMLRKSGVITSWEHEPKTFWFTDIKRGVRSYLPDFFVQYPDGSNEFHEVKGYMDSRSRTKLKRMAKYYPYVTVRVVDKKWFSGPGSYLTKLTPPF